MLLNEWRLCFDTFWMHEIELVWLDACASTYLSSFKENECRN